MDNQNFPNQPPINPNNVDSPPPTYIPQSNQAPFDTEVAEGVPPQKSRKNRGLIIIVVLLLSGLVGVIIWKTFGTSRSSDIAKDRNSSSISKSVVSPDMNFLKPDGWAEQVLNTNKNTTYTYTSPDGSGAKIVLILQESATRTKRDDLMATSKLKEIKLESELFGDQYTAEYNGASNTVTSFRLRVHFDVLMEEKFYNQPKYQQVYQSFLDSFVPNGTTNNQ